MPFIFDAVWQLAMDSGIRMTAGERLGRAAVAGAVGTVISLGTKVILVGLGVPAPPLLLLNLGLIAGFTIEPRLTDKVNDWFFPNAGIGPAEPTPY